MKKSKKNYVAIVLIVLLLALAVGYAAFSQTLTISGTANASGSWDVKFVEGSESITNSIVQDTTANEAKVATGGKTMTVTANLAMPGDGANVKVDITNAGTLDAKIKSFTVTGDGFAATENDANVYQNGAVLVKVPTVATGDELASGATKTFEFSVEWDSTVTSLTDAQTAIFTITFEYEQDGVTGTFNGTQNFTVKQ